MTHPATSPTKGETGNMQLDLGARVIATRPIYQEANEDTPGGLYAQEGDELEVRGVGRGDTFPFYVAHPDREPGAMFGVHAKEIRAK
jgi:hypothetical protein